ncbi:PREDICTED: sodium-coupled neutral amino acid transporter 3-like, partial [Nanorana parkeri]|uniref:sodium-coupled neutral amino acid transporter 3-like n=1 Tax=Nanorana parkeri TaxID=125878 RepID=UPI000854FB5D
MDFPPQTEMVDMRLGEKLNGTLGAETPDARYRDDAEITIHSLHGAPPSHSTLSMFEGKSSFKMSVFNLSNAIMGSGILGLAYAMANTGILLFLFLLTAVALLSTYSIHLLLKSSGIVGIRAYEQLGMKAFGTPGKMAAAIAITLQNIGAMSSYLYIVKSELPLVIQTFLKLSEKTSDWYLNGNYLVIMVSVCVILPLALMKQLGYLGYTSGFSLSCMVFFLCSVIYKKFQIPCPLPMDNINQTLLGNFSLPSEYAYQNGHATAESDVGQCTPKLFTLNSQTAYTIPIMAFAFVCHPEVLPIYTELKEGCHISCFVPSLPGHVESELLHTYSAVDTFDVLILCVRVAVLIAVTLTVPIVLFPVSRPLGGNPPGAVTLLAAVTWGFGVSAGATSAPCLIFIFPAIFY